MNATVPTAVTAASARRYRKSASSFSCKSNANGILTLV